MKIQDTAPEAYVSGKVETHSASISMTKEVFNILVKGIYKYPYMAIVREYICNAMDGHIAAGHREPLYIHVPTDLEPWFSVKDVGIGMSKEMVTTTFMCLGTSTKRDSNEMVGAKGIGSKSAFSCGDQFQVISTFNGIKSSYVVYMNKGIPDIAVVSELKTTDSNGVEVKIAIENNQIDTVTEAISQFLSFFDFPFEVNLGENWLKNVAKPVYAYQEKIGDFTIGILAEDQADHLENKIVMGGVAYESDYLENTCTEDCVVIVPIGKVNISPGREYTEETDNPEFIEELNLAFKQVKENYYSMIMDNVDKKDIIKTIEYYKQQTSQAKKVITDYFYSQYQSDLSEKVTVYKDRRKGYNYRFSGSSETPYIAPLLEGKAIFILKDRSNSLLIRAKQCKSSMENIEHIYSVEQNNPLIKHEFFSNLVYFASEFVLESDKPKERKPHKPRVAVKGHLVHYVDEFGKVKKDRISKKEFEHIEYYLVVENSNSAINCDTKKYGQIRWFIEDLVKDLDLKRLYLLTERQISWAKKAKELIVVENKAIEKELERVILEKDTDYNEIVSNINFLREVKSLSSRLKRKDGGNVPVWYTHLVPCAYDRLQTKVKKKEQDLHELYKKEKSDLLTIAPMLKFVDKSKWTEAEVRNYVKSQQKFVK